MRLRLTGTLGYCLRLGSAAVIALAIPHPEFRTMPLSVPTISLARQRLVPVLGPGALAGTALATAVTGIGVSRRVFVPPRAMGLRHVCGGEALPAQNIGTVGYRLHVPGVDAGSDAAEVIGFEPIRDGATQFLVGVAVCTPCDPLPDLDSDSQQAVPVPIAGAGPGPAPLPVVVVLADNPLEDGLSAHAGNLSPRVETAS